MPVFFSNWPARSFIANCRSAAAATRSSCACTESARTSKQARTEILRKMFIMSPETYTSSIITSFTTVHNNRRKRSCLMANHCEQLLITIALLYWDQARQGCDNADVEA